MHTQPQWVKQSYDCTIASEANLKNMGDKNIYIHQKPQQNKKK